MKKHIYFLFLAMVFSVGAKASVGDTTWVTVAPFDSLTHPGTFDYPVLFPDSTHTYRKIYFIFTVGQYNCPSTAQYCHQWDYDIENYIMSPLGDTVEFARFITPYATTGTPGFGSTWKQPYIFDVTDFYPIFKDSATIRINYSGYSYGFTMNVQFAFIEGTPERNVLAINPLWNSTYTYGDTASPIDSNLRALTFTPPATSLSTEMKLIITGHGYDGATGCCEFDNTGVGHAYTVLADNNQVAQTNMNINCGVMELYPQGGTWLYMRAGNWCPGGLVSTAQVPLTGITAGSLSTADINFDDSYNGLSAYGIYKIAAQAFSYSGYNKTLDASLEDIIAPTTFPWYRRENPRVSVPVIKIRNTGGATITSMLISYGVKDSALTQYFWTGSLASSADTVITLPAIPALTNLSLGGATGNHTFTALIEQVNGQTDNDPSNDTLSSQFAVAPKWPQSLLIRMKTSSIGANGNFASNPADASWQITDENGNVVASRTNANCTTTYNDTVKLNAAGFYALSVTTSQCYGLNWWALAGQTGYVPGSIYVYKLGGALLGLNGTSNSGEFLDDFGCGFVQYFTTPGECLEPIPTITMQGDTLISSSAATYQWYKNGNLITGATGRTYVLTPGEGNYMVEVANDSGCTNNSASFLAIATGMQNLADFANAISIYPNPSKDQFNLSVTAGLTGTSYAMTDLTGRTLLTGKIENESNIISTVNISSGIYLLTVFDGVSSVTKRVVVAK
jgi:hypothetical protein